MPAQCLPGRARICARCSRTCPHRTRSSPTNARAAAGRPRYRGLGIAVPALLIGLGAVAVLMSLRIGWFPVGLLFWFVVLPRLGRAAGAAAAAGGAGRATSTATPRTQ